MAKFKFRLATLLRLRESARDERRTELAQAYQADEIVGAEQERLESNLRALEKQTRQATAPGPLDVDWLIDVRRYELVLTSQKEHVAKQRRALEAEIERRRQALIDADREVRVLEELRRKQSDRHRYEESRLEVKRLDEVAGRRTAQEDKT
ncbi:MAG: flagellar export protein FliJ [Planctomycetota bacterium]|jgi:flagellar export protein FliJ